MALQVKDNVVVDENGVPADYFVFSLNEKIGLPNYSSVDIFASVGRYISTDNFNEEKNKVIEKVEEILEGERSVVLENLRNS